LPSLSDLTQEAHIAARSLADYVSGTGLRLGVTGLSRAGKTVFITALVHNLLRGGRLPVLQVHAQGRLIGARLEHQPDDAVPSFAYADHLAALTGGGEGPSARHWPQSTRRISQLRLTLQYERASGWLQGPRELTIDIVDYPGEWLLDLPLLEKSYAQWSRETLEAGSAAARATLAAPWRGYLASLDPTAPFSEEAARKAAELFTAYLRGAAAAPGLALVNVMGALAGSVAPAYRLWADNHFGTGAGLYALGVSTLLGAVMIAAAARVLQRRS
jgi:predicted YcjX-like family ATPase